ncbi:MAG: hypothetical protein RLZZ158_1128 [Cyanobacteriota bacterium]|jgi:hypothetical protein
MHRKILAGAALLPLLCGGVNAVQAQPTDLPKQERQPFERPTFTKEQQQNLFKLRASIEQKSHAGRIAILQEAERCVGSAQTSTALKTCEQGEREARKKLREQLRTEAEQLRSQYGLPKPPQGPWGQHRPGSMAQ